MLKTQEQYLKSYSHCPRCDSADIEGHMPMIDANSCWQEVVCNSCDLLWVDDYTLTSYEVSEE